MSTTGQAGGNAGGGSGLGQAANDLLKEMQKAQTDLQSLEKQHGAGNTTADAFGQVLQSQNGAGVAEAQGAQAAAHKASVVDVLREAKAQHAAPSTRVGATERTEETKLQKMITGLVHGQDKMTKIMHDAMSGKQFSPGELLAMQVGVYRFSQELDLTSKVVQTATSGIKQTLNTQV
jgi:hypothetical protein